MKTILKVRIRRQGYATRTIERKLKLVAGRTKKGGKGGGEKKGR